MCLRHSHTSRICPLCWQVARPSAVVPATAAPAAGTAAPGRNGAIDAALQSVRRGTGAVRWRRSEPLESG